jgi:hypothetical protein
MAYNGFHSIAVVISWFFMVIMVYSTAARQMTMVLAGGEQYLLVELVDLLEAVPVRQGEY